MFLEQGELSAEGPEARDPGLGEYPIADRQSPSEWLLIGDP